MSRSVDSSADRRPGPGLEPASECQAAAKSEDTGLRLTRRQLLRLGMVGAGMVALGTVAARQAAAEDLIRGGSSVSRTTGTFRRSVPSSCAQCPARCSILGFVEEGRLVKIEGNPRDPNSRGRLCANGHAGINRLYDPDRILYPMKREGKRGEGKWSRVSWEEAYNILEPRFRDLRSREAAAFVLHMGVEGASLLARRFAAAVGSKVLVEESYLRVASRETANQLTMGTHSDIADVAHARYILNFGSNPYETHPLYLPFVQRLVDARANGAKLVTFDPRMSLTAGRSDEWFPVVPGTDGVIILAMANVIVQQGLHDREFISRWMELSPEELARSLSPYTPEKAEAFSGMRADDIRRIATEFARARPSVAIFGGGLGHQEGATDTQRAAILLNAIVGSVGTPGGYCPAPTMAFPEPDPPPPPCVERSDAIRMVEELLHGSRSVDLYMACLANPAYSWPNPEAFRSALSDESRVPFFVAVDTNLTETSLLADLVLPAATYLESWGLESPPPMELTPFVTLRQPIVKPRGESLSVDDILLTLGTRLDPEGSRYFPFPNMESYLNSVISKLPDVSRAGGFAILRERGVWFDLSATPHYRPAADAFATPSGKLEFGQITTGTGSNEGQTTRVTPSSPEQSRLTLITYRPNVQLGDYSANCWWLSEIAHNNVLLMNPLAAQRRGIRQGQRVKVVSSVGSAEVKVRITEGIHPDVVALASGFGHQALGRIAQSERFKSEDPMTAQIWWHQRGNGVNPSSLIPGKIDSAGSLVWSGTEVKIEAIG